MFENNGAIGDEGESPENGGAVWMTGGASPTFNVCTFLNNFARDNGGAVYIDSDSANPFFNNCRFENNIADDDGGAIYSNYGQPFIYNGCFFGGNTAGNLGGAIFATGADTRFPNIGEAEFCGNLLTNPDPDEVEHIYGIDLSDLGPDVLFYDFCSEDCNNNGVRDDVDIDTGLEQTAMEI